MDKNCENLACRRNKVGGQALIEGVMMKHGDDIAIAVRKDDGSVEIKKEKFVSVKKKHKWLGLPIIRGVVGFIESMVLSMKTMNISTDMLGIDEEIEKEKKKKQKNKNKPEKEKKKDSGGFTLLLMGFSIIFGLALALLLFMWLPSTVTQLIDDKLLKNYDLHQVLKAIIEGAVKIAIFVAYILVVSFMKDIRRVFQYHGAEHKSIACYESGMELTPENAKKCTRFHPRCGTSFMFVMLIIGIIIGAFIPVWDKWLRTLIKIAILPLTMGIGYEFIMYAGKHDNLFTRMCSAPGLWMQRITTREPDEKQLAIAICAIKSSMPEEFPNFDLDEYDIDVEDNLEHFGFTGLNKKERAEFIERKKAEKAEKKKQKELLNDEDISDIMALDGVDEAELEAISENKDRESQEDEA
ncbi:MAG: DUF1385 domain-containing protein [Clostridia bacterium]|nr:DUF1385 domain-containing protein [Clostridia bacterium]